MNDTDAVSALKRLGLTAYEARTFIGLQKLGTGTASEVADITDVPRSQVYGTAEDLEERGLIEIERSNPTRYRPVGVEEARDRLFHQLDSAGETAFEYLASVREEFGTDQEESESVWTVRGASNIESRSVSLLASADSTVVYGTDDTDRLTPELRQALADAAERGVEITALSDSDAVLDALSGFVARTVDMSERAFPEIGATQVLMVDGTTVLISVLSADGTEIAFWSGDTAFASMLTTLLNQFVVDVASRDT